jgi:hypothetical protein
MHWLELLGEAVELWRVVVHGYAQMGNHFHLLLETREANLSRLMHWLNTSYVSWFNRRHGRVGPLFQGVYKSILVDRVAWGLALSRYMHLNPVRTKRLGLSKADQKADRLGVRGKPQREVVAQRLQKLRNYRWSSYRGYAGLEKPPAWLECGSVLELNGKGQRREQQRAYQSYVEEAIREGLEESPLEEVKAQIVLGSRGMLEKVRQAVGGRRREQPQARGLAVRPSFGAIKAVVEDLRGQKWEDFQDQYGDWGRELALYLGQRAGALKLKELGEEAGGADYAAVSAAIKRFEKQMRGDSKLARLAEKALRRLDNVAT